MPNDIDHDEARRIAALQQPNHALSMPYMDAITRLEKAEAALKAIGNIAAASGEAGAMNALKECQRIAAAVLPEEKKVIKFKNIKDVQGQ